MPKLHKDSPLTAGQERSPQTSVVSLSPQGTVGSSLSLELGVAQWKPAEGGRQGCMHLRPPPHQCSGWGMFGVHSDVYLGPVAYAQPCTACERA